MIPQITKTLEEYINGGGEMYQNTLFNHFPSFVIDNTLTLNFYDLFVEKYDIREIGAESDTIFAHFLRETLNYALIEYVPKINMFIDNFNDLFKFTVQLSYTESKSSSGENNTTYYLSPTTSTTTNLKVQNVDKDNGTTSANTIRTRDVLQSVWGKTRADLLEKIMELRSIYNDCLNSFEKLFLGVY